MARAPRQEGGQDTWLFGVIVDQQPAVPLLQRAQQTGHRHPCRLGKLGEAQRPG